MIVVLIGIAVLCLVALAALAYQTWKESIASTRAFIADFRKAFPHRCMICSYHYYGQSHGHVPESEVVEAHICIDRNNQQHPTH